MKKQHLNQKLVLNKETIENLGREEEKIIKGGATRLMGPECMGHPTASFLQISCDPC